MQAKESELWHGGWAYRGVFVKDAMMKIIVLVVLALAFSGLLDQALVARVDR
jgi:Na+/H+ antiporter NhaC